MVVINNTDVQNGVLFTVISGYTGSESFRWYVNDVLVGTNSFYILENPSGGETVYVIMDSDVNGDWYDGHFYGGIFNGNWHGGTFHYGILNGIEYLNINKKPKKFIQ